MKEVESSTELGGNGSLLAKPPFQPAHDVDDDENQLG
jgi:hypothetical protein